MKPDWSKAPVDAEAGIANKAGFYDAWYKRGGNGQVYQICPGAGVHSWSWMGGRVDFPANSETRPVAFPLNNAHVKIPSVSGQELLLSALKNCVSVMDKELNGLAVIQPELMAAKAAIDACEVVDAEYADWDGESLPPAGTDCEFLVLRHGDSSWTEGEILYSSLHTVVISGNGFEHVHHPHTLKFRPIRTPEQIEDDERQQAITQMLSFVKGDVGRDVLFDLYEAGYRKQVEP